MSFGDAMSSNAASRINVSNRRSMLSSGLPPASIAPKMIKIPAAQQLRVREKVGSLFEQVFHSLYDGVLITNAVGRIQESNVRAEQLLRFTRDELHGSEIIRYIHSADPKLIADIRATTSREHAAILQGSCIRKDQTLFPVEIAVSRLRDAKDEHLCFLIRDVTERKKAEKLVLKAQDERLETEKIKARMSTISTLSHEFNNPLQLLLSMAEKDELTTYQLQLNRIIGVLKELQRQDILKQIISADGIARFELDIRNADIKCKPDSILIVDDEAIMVTVFKDIL